MKAGWIEEPSLNFSAIVITDDESGDTFAVQRSFSFEEQDRLLNQATYCLVRGGAAYYGGVENYDLTASSLRLTLASSAASALGLPVQFDINLSPADVTLLAYRLPGLLDA